MGTFGRREGEPCESWAAAMQASWRLGRSTLAYQFNAETAPGQWTYRVVAKHVLSLEQDSLKTVAPDHAAREDDR